MIDITRNIVVTAENVEEVLDQLRNRLIGEIALSMLEVRIGAELYSDPEWGFMLRTVLAAKKTAQVLRKLIDRIELVKGDLYKESDSRFHTMPEDKFRCQDCAAFGFTTMWKDKHGYWELPEFGYRTRSVLVPVKVSLDI